MEFYFSYLSFGPMRFVVGECKFIILGKKQKHSKKERLRLVQNPRKVMEWSQRLLMNLCPLYASSVGRDVKYIT